ncbi:MULTISPECIES: cation-transporting P-type ATPase [unclassified Breznakia]|uniref:cation-translocating P-type ATPase n=1 Tax=unclassified Breznakia TaxID=2623764 RepID=UPI0024768142|nr:MULTISPECIES: cation-transporting P-type ATPase [unclassified Breznakia]MDH6365974.1 Ca2+-transporting ATPase [Breznakia sp. PH1-1]MDH6403094.1 Ca2+-transporting ATPase [Breznakia sp. PF1-11]MDH6410803.1 Ca2+-transporting ATPase [Breznakia sp. PFB1-11]MDH6413140.1 Ca2+-transporting ATPase [Breznakia sp. PFB1-14]MDH6415508.1 Ca2+-transporting ATPase [Breznakia sp. PFB1-4]
MEKKNLQIYKLPPQEVYEQLGSKPQGLSSDELDRLRATYGKNEIEEVKGEPTWKLFLGHFTSMMAILLWFGGIVAIIAEMPELGIAIWLVNVINGLFSFWQEFQAGKATDALKKMLPSYARVIRDGQEQQILTEELLPGDVMLVEEGDKISADARLVETSDFQANQSALTGESNPVHKQSDAVLKDDLTRFEYPNLIFAGTSVSSGSGKAVVTAIGMNTEFGKIANLTQNMEVESSPLQKELDRLTRQISMIAAGIGLFFFIAAIVFVHDPVAKSFIFALGMMVAFIPEGLLPTVTLSLAMAVQRMAKEHALVKKLSAVETLGSTSVICSDKTGTLTQNEMTVSDIWLPNKEYKVTGLGYSSEGSVELDGKAVTYKDDKDLDLLLRGMALCSNARIVPPNEDNDRFTVLGDPTEACLGVVAQKAKIDLTQLAQEAPRVRELPFDSRRKRMTTIHQMHQEVDGSKRIAFIKGAPKEVMELSTHIIVDGQKVEMSEAYRTKIMEANDTYARNGLRVLALSYRPITKDSNVPVQMSAYTPEIIEQDMVFVGLVVMLDPPRPEVAAAVELCHKASIRIVMVTGDYGLTAESIAKRIGIVKGENPRVVSGMELESMEDDELKQALKDEIIFARVAPEQKYRVVSMLQEMGETVAVTGDGVNDSPALKKADIGVAMGITGTDVAKEAADMILTDDNFASIVKAVEEGRAVYANIRRFLLYILNSNMAEAVPSAAFLFSGGLIPLPLTVMQILAIDLGTDMLPALGLGTELPEEGIMDQPPRKKSDRLLSKSLIIKAFLWYGLIAAVISMAGYFLINIANGWPNVPLASSGAVYKEATTMTLAAIVFCQIGAVINCRTNKRSVFTVGLFSNKKIVFGIVFEIVLLALLMYVPFLQDVFNTGPLGLTQWIILALIPIPVVALEELRKKIMYGKEIANQKSSSKGVK